MTTDDDGTRSHGELEELVARAFAALEQGGEDAFEALCKAHPEHEAELRACVARVQLFELAASPGPRTGEEPGGEREVPERLGDFRLVERLGQGGMGVVYRAEQVSLGREVALKLVRPELLYFPGHAERFRREVRAVASMQHPGIVPVYTVGEERGVPYFAMELIAGSSLASVLAPLRGREPAELTGRDLAGALSSAAEASAEDATDSPLTGSLFEGSWIDASLRIARQIADALEHAHARGVVHRDVKPSNVQITPSGRAMLLDFGLSRSDGTSQLTKGGSQPGSLPYMSPEQLAGDARVDGRTDVYSLGVTLWELLAARRAFEGPSAEHVRRHIAAGELPRLRDVNPRVPWDVETVCLKAIEIDRERRYASAEDFSRDLGNLLARRPIEARRPGPWLRVLRWSQRHPTASVAGLVALVLLALSAFAFGWQRDRHAAELRIERDLARDNERDAKRERDRAGEEKRRADAEADEARRQRAAADRVVEFLVGLFEGADPRKHPESITAKELLDGGARSIATELAQEPLVRARLMEVMGRAYHSLGLYGASEPLIVGALELRREHSDEADLDVLINLANLGFLRFSQGRYSEAEEHLVAALDGLEAARAPADLHTLRACESLAQLRVRQGRHDEAVELFERVLAGRRNALGSDHRETVQALSNLSTAYALHGRAEDAQPIFEEVVERMRARHGDLHEDVVIALFNLAENLQRLGRFEEAEPLARELVDTCTRIFGPTQIRTLQSRDLLGIIVGRAGRIEEGQAILRDVLELKRENLGPHHPETLRSLNHVAVSLSHQGRYDEVEALQLEALAGLRTQFGPDNPQVQKVLWGLADMLHALGRDEDAYPYILELVEATPASHPEMQRRRRLLDEIRALLEGQ